MRVIAGMMLAIVLLLASCSKSLDEATATCFDGIQNQGETAIDCGGPCTGACPTCTDGIKNQGEASVDCGGPCPNTCATIDCTTCNNVVQGGQSQTFCEDQYVSEAAYHDAINNAIANGSTCD